MTTAPTGPTGPTAPTALPGSVLVANRGEIALRVFRTCRDLGVRTVAVATAVDAGAPHTRAADATVPVDSYLDGPAIVAAALAAGASAVHPGYGFLSENAAFARAVVDAGLTWIGPAPEVIEAMGRKDRAREIAVAAGVPVVPSYGLDDDPADLAYPVLVKAAAGGGGKGMRVVRSADELPAAVAAAGREARAAFGDDTLLIEKYVERGRHIEVQVMGDAFGTVVHLLDRDCSAQRRHQKVVEEAPAPARSAGEERQAAQRRDDAVRLAREVGYAGAGTVEFLVDLATGEHYFLEMNTRLQVEHPVTEQICGVDLVALQLQVATGHPDGALGDAALAGLELAPRGHAIEVRLYAEDAWNGFLPQAGTPTEVHWPPLTPLAEQSGAASGTRLDHALEAGRPITTAYDPMLGKLVVWGRDRESARLAMVRALEQTAVLGVTTNVGFLRALVAADAFRDLGEDGGLDTAWLDRVEIGGPDLPAPDEGRARTAAATRLRRDAVAPGADAGPFAPDGWRGASAAHAYRVPWLGEAATDDDPDGAPPVRALRRSAHAVEVVVEGQRWVFEEPDPFRASAAAAGDGTVTAPMPGTVVTVEVREGQRVATGDLLVTMEAMKMELSLSAPFDGVVRSLGAAAGASVPLGAVLAVVDPEDAA